MRSFKNPLKLLLPALLAFLVSAQSAGAQNLIGFSPNTLSGWRDTVYVGDSAVVLGGLLKNYSSTNAFTDTLYLQGTVDTGAAPVPFSIAYPWQFYISPLDSQLIVFSIDFDTISVGAPAFHVGNNVVVVWPIGVGPGGWQPKDSLTLNVVKIDTINGFGPEPPGGFLRIYPVPANGPLVISSYHPQYHITYVTIRDAFGKTVYQGVPSGPIDTQSWAYGLYTVEASLSNGTVSWYKIMRQ